MSLMVVAVAFLVVLGSLLAMAEAAISRMSRVRAMAMAEEGRRNAQKLERIEQEPTRYLNSVYLAVMFAQNGSATLVAIIAGRLAEYRDASGQSHTDWRLPVISVAFTLLYFIFVEAMSKTFAILHSDRVALGLAPLVVLLARILSGPTRILISIANVLIPGKGIKQGPFVSEEEIRQMADVGHEEGAIERDEREMIHSIFELGDTVVREVMVPRPDMLTLPAAMGIREALDIALDRGYSRIPVFTDTQDDIIGVVYTKDLFRTLSRAEPVTTVGSLVRTAYFVPDTKKVADLLKEMRQKKVHMAIVSDEYGDVAGLVTLEDLIEEIVGEIYDETDMEEADILQIGPDTWRVKGKLSIAELNEHLDAELPDEEWDTVGGLVMSALGKLPEEGEEVDFGGFRFRTEKLQGRRIASVLITRLPGQREQDSA